MSDTRTVTLRQRRRTEEGPGAGAGNHKLLKRYITRAESLCKDAPFQKAVDAARTAWNEQHPSFPINPVFPRDSRDRTLGNASLANASADAWKHGDLRRWESLQPEVIDWFDRLEAIYVRAFPPLIWDTGFAEGQPIGMNFIAHYMLLGPGPLKGKCSQYFPTLREIYEQYAHRVVANGSCLPLDANTTAADLREFALYALPIVRKSTSTNETFIGLAIDGLRAGSFTKDDIAFRLGLTPRAVKDWLESNR